jgi:hypothetical protein
MKGTTKAAHEGSQMKRSETFCLLGRKGIEIRSIPGRGLAGKKNILVHD